MHLKTTGDAGPGDSLRAGRGDGQEGCQSGGLSDSRDWQTQVMIPACWVTAVRDKYEEPVVAHVDWEVAACAWDLNSGKTAGDIP